MGGDLVSAELLAAVGDQLLLGRPRARRGDDEGAPDLAHALVRDRDDVRLLDVLALGQDALDLGRHDRLGPAAVQVLRAAGELEVAVGPDAAEVARPQAAAGVERVAVLLGRFPIAVRDDRPADDELAGLAVRQRLGRDGVDRLVAGEQATEGLLARDAAGLRRPTVSTMTSIGSPGIVNVVAAEVSVIP